MLHVQLDMISSRKEGFYWQSMIASALGIRGFNVRLIASALERRGSMSDLGEVRMLDVQLDSVSSRKEGFYCQIWVE